MKTCLVLATALLAPATVLGAPPPQALPGAEAGAARGVATRSVDVIRAGLWFRHRAARGLQGLAGTAWTGALKDGRLTADTVRVFLEAAPGDKLIGQVQLSAPGLDEGEVVTALRRLTRVELKPEARALHAESLTVRGTLLDLVMDRIGRLRGTLALRVDEGTGWLEVPVVLIRTGDPVPCEKPCDGTACDLSTGECIDVDPAESDLLCTGDGRCPDGAFCGDSDAGRYCEAAGP